MRFLLIIALLWATPILAQTYPDHISTEVNDFADLLSPSKEELLSRQLSELRRETGVEMTIVTLETQADFAPDISMERFATGLFNHWGIGDADRNDGVMILVLRQDRAMRIELGRGYGREWDIAAQRIINRDFLTAFAANDYEQGVANGTTAIIDDIIMPFLNGDRAPRSVLRPIVFFVGAVGALAVFSSIPQGSNLVTRLRRCPSCGQRSLRQNSQVLMPPTRASHGSGIRHIFCINCDYSDRAEYNISRLSPASGRGGRSFGGGSSGGGGASGRW